MYSFIITYLVHRTQLVMIANGNVSSFPLDIVRLCCVGSSSTKRIHVEAHFIGLSVVTVTVCMNFCPSACLFHFSSVLVLLATLK